MRAAEPMRWADGFAGALVVVLAVAFALTRADTVAAEPRHGLSAFGKLKYPRGFQHFTYVNPDAPKGGRMALVGTRGLNTFDSFNGYILKGDAAQGTSYLFEGFSLIFDTLMARAYDEPDAMYGLVAKSADLADDGRSVIFDLRPEAHFADGSKLTAQDVKFSFDVLKAEGYPTYKTMLRDVKSPQILSPTRIRYTFQGDELRDLPLIVAGLPIFSKAFYSKVPFGETSLKPPLGSGPYAIDRFQQGRFVAYRRRDDYWAKELPVNRGRWNFDLIRFEYFRDRTAALETLKAGGYDLREEFTSKDWATAYNVPQVRDGRMVLTTLKDERPSGAQGFMINTRKTKFADPRVRQALDLAFDFEWTNKNLFYNLYKRTGSYFENSPMKAVGPPSQDELALLEPYREKLPEHVFGKPYSPPVSDGTGSDRKLLRKAHRLLRQAGFTRQAGQRVNADGERLKIEFLTFEPSFERVILPYIRNLELLGIEANVRRVDPAQYERRVKSFDYDIMTQRFAMGLTPGISMRNYFSSASADIQGSFNLPGIKNQVIDTLIDKAIGAGSRADLTTAVRAMDRVLRAGHYWVPHWYKASHNIAHWNRFGRPEVKPRYDDGVLDTWWFDAAKAARISAN